MSKYEYIWVVQGFYGRWEDLTCGSWLEAKLDLKAYRENETGVFRLIQRRVLREL